ncbi:MAG: cytochrome c3 family protein [Polaromonas sp.]|nr:cytochrome c3 family protein [Polaromonas sp.]
MSLFKDGRARWAGGVATALLALGVLGSAPALAGIANTKHNLGALGTGANKFTGTQEICVFCHTPHGADISAAVPLWNRVLAAPTTYQTYNSLGTSSLDGATAPVGSVSLACLSCHDGGQAMNVMINQPGSGTTVAGLNITPVTGQGNLTADGKIGAGVITNIGTDLRNDHPIGIQYGGGMPGNIAYPAAAVADGGFRDKDFRGVQWSNLNGNDVWWVDTPGTGAAGTREKTDMQLYTRLATGTSPVPGATGNQALVECASCHDPHSENPTFLRVANTNSAVCLACHIK